MRTNDRKAGEHAGEQSAMRRRPSQRPELSRAEPSASRTSIWDGAGRNHEWRISSRSVPPTEKRAVPSILFWRDPSLFFLLARRSQQVAGSLRLAAPGRRCEARACGLWLWAGGRAAPPEPPWKVASRLPTSTTPGARAQEGGFERSYKRTVLSSNSRRRRSRTPNPASTPNYQLSAH